MVGGLSVANIAGVPAGSFLGQHAGWRASFWGVAILAGLGITGVALLVPRTAAHVGTEAPRLRREARIHRDRRVWLAVGTIACNAAATFALFSYLAPLLTEVSGLVGAASRPCSSSSGSAASSALFSAAALPIPTSSARCTPVSLPLRRPSRCSQRSLRPRTGPPRSHSRSGSLPSRRDRSSTPGYSMSPPRRRRLPELRPPRLSTSATPQVPGWGGLVIGAGLGYRTVALTGGVLAAGAVLLTVLAARTDRCGGRG